MRWYDPLLRVLIDVVVALLQRFRDRRGTLPPPS